ncbi:MAG: protoporphyrinogen oxidase [Paludibacter sp.]|jgi:oxygen-dependent protoporphyrinogen oxidase|nr:protoporphyrinogen oxidase [Paludibacter sp.]
MTNESFDSIIIGAGLTGLTIAHYLRRAGLRVLVLDNCDAPGGVIRSRYEDCFLYESGPNTGVISSVALVRLFEELSLSFEVPRHYSHARWIWKGNRWEPLPSGLLSAIKTPLFTFSDKLRILAEPFRKKGTNPDETLAELVIRRMGRSFLDYAIDPFISGIYAGDPTKLVTRYAMPKLYALEQTYGSFIKGSAAKARQHKSTEEKKVTKEVFSLKGGLSKLTEALVGSVGEENIQCNCTKIEVSEPREGSYSVKYTLLSETDVQPQVISSLSKTVISTVGATSLPELFPFLSKEETESLNSLLYAKVVQVAVGYKHWDGIPIQAFGGLVPSSEKKDILGILFPSALFEGRAPEQGALLSVFMGGIKRPDLFEQEDDKIIEIALKHISEMMQASVKPDLVRIFRYRQAIPQYDASSGKRLQTINELQFRYPGLLLAGNIRDGIGMSDRVKQGYAVAQEVIDFLNISKFS